jgi:hypothetical protein
MDEHRISSRHRVLKAGTIEFSGSKIDCLVRNISATGAAIEIKTPIWFPDSFTLAIASDGTARRCHIVWRSEGRIGVAFDDQG